MFGYTGCPIYNGSMRRDQVNVEANRLCHHERVHHSGYDALKYPHKSKRGNRLVDSSGCTFTEIVYSQESPSKQGLRQKIQVTITENRQTFTGLK